MHATGSKIHQLFDFLGDVWVFVSNVLIWRCKDSIKTILFVKLKLYKYNTPHVCGACGG